MSHKIDHNKEITIEGLRVDISATLQREGEGLTKATIRCCGVVKWFNPTKGFGFITPEDGGADVFVHQSEIQLGGFRSLAQGEVVEYDLLNGEKGPKALRVTGPNGAPPKGAPRQPKVMFIDSDKTYYTASKNENGVSKLIIGNQIPVYTSGLSAVPNYTNHYVKRNVQYSPLSPKQIGFVHSPIASGTHSSYHLYSPRDYPISNSWPTTPPAQKSLVDPSSPIASPQFHFPVQQNPSHGHTTIPLSPTFTNSYQTSFNYPTSTPYSPPTTHTHTAYGDGLSTANYGEFLAQGLGDLSLSSNV